MDVSLFEIGKNAIGPFFVNIWVAVLFFIFLCFNIVVYARLSYFLSIFFVKNLFDKKLFESQLIIKSYLFFFNKSVKKELLLINFFWKIYF